MQCKLWFVFCLGIYAFSYACHPDMSSIGIVLNNGEYFAYDKIESFGSEGANYLKELIALPNQTTPTDTIVTKGAARKTRASSAALMSASFQYDPTATASFLLGPQRPARIPLFACRFKRYLFYFLPAGFRRRQ
jgi:hypothetical protein